MSFAFDPPPSMAFDHRVSWTMKEPVLVAWPDNEPDDSNAARTLSLGQPCYMDGRPNVTLWVGESAKEKMATVMLHMSFSIKVSSRKKTFDLFLILPTNNLRIHYSSLSLENLPSDVYCSLETSSWFEAPGRRRLLHLGFVLDGTSQVLMPRWPETAKPVTGTPLHLMMLLRSLSQMHALEAYIAYSSYSAETLKNLRARFDNGMVNLPVDMDGAYGGAGGCYDKWKQFNVEYLSGGSSLERVSTLSNLKHSLALSDSHGVRHSPAVTKRLRMSSPEHAPPDEIHTNHHTHSADQNADASQAGPPPPYAQPATSPRHTPGGPPKPALSTILVPESEFAPSPAYLSVDLGDYIPETPEQVLGEDIPVSTCAHHLRSQLTSHNIEPYALLPPAPLLASGAPNAATALRSSMISWILTMKTVDASFYKAMRLHHVLLSLGQAVLNQNRAEFITAKARGTTIVLAKAATAAGRCSPNAQPRNLLRDLDLLTQWMYSLDLDADMATLPYLRSMALWAVAHRQHMKTHPASDEIKQVDVEAAGFEAEFRRCEAECIVEFYVRTSA